MLDHRSTPRGLDFVVRLQDNLDQTGVYLRMKSRDDVVSYSER